MTLQEFIEDRDLSEIRAEVGSFGETPYSDVVSALAHLNSISPLSGKKLIDMGCGDLRMSLVAVNSFGMESKAVEISPEVSALSEQVLAEAAPLGFSQGKIMLYPQTDALALDWSDVDLVVFSYVEGNDFYEFRERLADKFKTMKPGAVMGVLYASYYFFMNTLVTDVNPVAKILRLDTLPAIKLSNAYSGYWLQPYQR